VNRKYIRRWYRQSGKRIDRTGMIKDRLLYLEWLGVWRGRQWWRALCDCGRTCEVMWRRDVKSCGCANEEANRARDFRTQRPDGGWGLKTEKRLVLQDGRQVTIRQLARELGISIRAMHNRVERWPIERWLAPPQYVGKRARRRHELIAQKTQQRVARRPQPWASAVAKAINAAGLNRPKRLREPRTPSDRPRSDEPADSP